MVLVLHLKQRGQYPRWMDSICLLEQQTLPIAMIQCRWIYVDLRKVWNTSVSHLEYTLYYAYQH